MLPVETGEFFSVISAYNYANFSNHRFSTFCQDCCCFLKNDLAL